MLINVVEFGAILKIVQLETDTGSGKLCIRRVCMRHIDDLARESVKLEVADVLSAEFWVDAQHTIILPSTEVEFEIQAVSNALDRTLPTKEIQKITKEVLSASKTGFCTHFTQISKQSDHHLHVLFIKGEESVRKDIYDITAGRVKHPIATGVLHMTGLPYNHYNVIDIGYNTTKVFEVREGKLVYYDNTIGGTKGLLGTLGTPLEDQLASSYSITQHDITKTSTGGRALSAMVDNIVKTLSAPIVLTTGGGVLLNMFNESTAGNDKHSYISLDKHICNLCENLEEPLGNYLSNIILTAEMFANQIDMPSILGSKAYLNKITKVTPVLVRVAIVALAAFITSSALVMTNRQMSFTGSYAYASVGDSPGIVRDALVGYQNIPEITTGVTPVETTDIFNQLDEKADLAEKNIENMLEKLVTSTTGARLNSSNRLITLYTTAEMYSVRRLSPKTLELKFRGDVTDVQISTKILAGVWGDVRLEIDKVHYLETFSVITYKVIVNE